jgi:hypothetical protein
VTVECPRCGTTYRPPAREELAADASFRCGRCRHVFAVDAEPDAEDEEEQFTLGDEDESESADADEGSEPPPARARRAPREGNTEDESDSGASPARFALRSLLIVTLGYGILSIYLYTHPAETRDLVRRVPVIGPFLVETHLDPTSVRLIDVRGEYQRVQNDHLVFVVAGTAVNASSAPVKGIQVAAHIRGSDEKRQVVFCGGTPRNVHDLSLREIALLQTIEPPKDWALGPGDQTPFLVVFTGVPPDLREYGAEVVAVRAPRSGA